MKRIIILFLFLAFNIIGSDILNSQGIDDEKKKTMFKHIEYEIERKEKADIAEMIAFIEREAEIKIPTYVDIKYITYMYNKSIELDLPIRYIFRLINMESRFRDNALSHVGAKGFMQLMPKTESLYINRLNLNETKMLNKLNMNYVVDENLMNITIGLYMLNDLNLIFKHKKNKWEHILASYNAGIGNVRKYGGVPPFAETRKYVAYILRDKGFGTKINI